MSAAPGRDVGEPSVRVAVTVTFLRMDHPPLTPRLALPDDAYVVHVPRPEVGFYRYLYHTVGEAYVWWLRRSLSDAALASVLADPAIAVHVLYGGGAPAGFFELDRRTAPDMNLSYFGLLPHAVGTGLGSAFLRAAIDEAWRARPRAVTVNTCTADHPRALPTYLRAGFRPMRSVREVWDVPLRLGLPIPEHLRA